MRKKSKVWRLVPVLVFLIVQSALGQNQIIIPDTIAGTEFELTLQNGTFEFYTGVNTTTMGVNGNILGPTLIMEKNSFVEMQVNNNLNDTTTIHWHGMHVSAENDGGPHTIILPGSSWNPSFQVLDKAGTYWYHPHLHEKTNKHVSLGIAGFILVRDGEEAALNLPRDYGVDDFPLAIQTKDFDSNNEIVVPSNSDDVVMVNATIDGNLTVPAQIVRLRLLNGSSQRVFNIGLSSNQVFHQIASDGGLLTSPNAVTRLQMAPGERAEILIDFSSMQGQSVNLMSYASEFSSGIYGAGNPGMMSMMSLNGYNPNPLNGNDFSMMSFTVGAATSNPVSTIPPSLVSLNPYEESNADVTRNIVFTPEAMGQNQLNGHFLINGSGFDMNVINYTIPLDNIEIWSIFNQSAISHPFHIHDVQFYVLDRGGATPPPSEQGLKDVILIKPMETVRIITKFEDFANSSVPYMYHCHMLVHEDGGMMGQFTVVDNSTDINNMNSSGNGVDLFPNPAGETVTIKLLNKDEFINQMEIYTITGSMVYSMHCSQQPEININVESMDRGVYLMTVYTGTAIKTIKFIKQ
jgi:FtsP/CotA-like multicopper oxidase with cupredoxin domain